MNTPVLREAHVYNQINQPPTLLVRISEPHGYRFDGDTVHLQARFTVLDPAAYQRKWALQLWACPRPLAAVADLSGQIVAEVALPPMREIADDAEAVVMNAFARPPAGGGGHFLALVLASGEAGRFEEIHDLAVYPRREFFLPPRMRGNVGYRLEADRVRLSVEHIENPRDALNRSGTLALELWAMAAPFTGGAIQDARLLAGVVLGTLAGQTESATTSFDLPFDRPPDGKWHFVMMLREWTAAGYVTRDFTNFLQPVNYGAPAVLTAPVVAAPPAMPALSTASGTTPSGTGLMKIRAAEQTGVKAGRTEAEASPKEKQPAGIVPKAPKPAPEADHLVSVNHAHEQELASIEGVSLKLARNVIKKRPFASLDDLRRVKGVTVKLLGSIRTRLKL